MSEPRSHDVIRFRVNGIPAPQGSKRHVGGGRMVESSRAVGPWREAVRAEAQRALALGPISDPMCSGDGEIYDKATSVTVVFVLARPVSHFSTSRGRHQGVVRQSAPRYPAKRPDLDKLARAVLDGLVAGGVMADDSQVVSLNCMKTYASNGEAPGAVIEVETMQ